MDVNTDGFLNNASDCLLLQDEDSLDLCVDFLVASGHDTMQEPDACPRDLTDDDIWGEAFEDDMSSSQAADLQSCHLHLQSDPDLPVPNTLPANPGLIEDVALLGKAELDVFSFPDLPGETSTGIATDKLSFDGREQLDWGGLYPEHQQENRQSSANSGHGTGAKIRAAAASEIAQIRGFVKSKPDEGTVLVLPRIRDKSTQRKLRNKESARRYREKQVAKRRQLEEYTRSLAEQNRELESLHEKLLTLTCDAHLAK
jgi:Basic region leucine zipper